jgi:hypothetical protein
MTAVQLFAVMAVMEVGAGLALLVAPVLVISLLFITQEIQPAVAIGRLAGAALISLGAACWWARHDDGTASRGLVTSLLIYNAAVVALVLGGGFGARSLIWAFAALHATMAIWCVRSLQHWPVSARA